MDNEATAPEKVEKVYASVDEMVADGATEVEYATIDGFKPGTKIRIGSVTAGDMIEWSEANEGEAKRTAGLRLICKSLVGPEKPPPGPVNPAFVPNHRYADDPRNIPKFRSMKHKETERIVKDILRLNGMNVKKGGKTEGEADGKND